MIRLLLCAVLLLPAAGAAGSTFEMQTAAREWADGFPIGNGALGGMVMGGVASDRVALNHNRLWRRSMQRRDFRVAGKLAEFRRLFLAGRYEEAGRLIETDVMVTGGTRYQYVNPFQPLGDLWLEFHHQGEEGVSLGVSVSLATTPSHTSSKAALSVPSISSWWHGQNRWYTGS